MENSPQCMTYIPWKTDSINEDTILFGDDQGKCLMEGLEIYCFEEKSLDPEQSSCDLVLIGIWRGAELPLTQRQCSHSLTNALFGMHFS